MAYRRSTISFASAGLSVLVVAVMLAPSPSLFGGNLLPPTRVAGAAAATHSPAIAPSARVAPTATPAPSYARPSGNASVSAWTLGLTNDTLSEGLGVPSNQPLPGSAAVDPENGRIFVQSNAGPENLFPSNLLTNGTTALLAVDPRAGAVVSSYPVTNCTPVYSHMGVVYDPNNGLLYTLCNGDSMAGVNASTGAVVARIPLGGYDTGNCSYFLPAPRPVSLLLGAPSHELFALVFDCVGTSPLGFTNASLSLAVVDDRTNSVAFELGFANDTAVRLTASDDFLFRDSEAMAFDPVAGLLYVDTSLQQVTVVSPSTEAVVGVVAAPSPGGLLQALVYSPTAHEVLASGIVGAGTSNGFPAIQGELVRLSPSRPGTAVVASWPMPNLVNDSLAGVYSFGPWPVWLAAGSGPGGDVTVVGERELAVQSSSGSVLEVNLTVHAPISHLTTTHATEAIVTAGGPGIVLVGTDNGEIEVVAADASHIVTSVPVGTLPYGTAVDPVSGVVYAAEGSLCGSEQFAAPSQNYCTNQSIGIVDPAVGRIVAQWALPAGLVSGMLVDPRTEDLYVLLVCGYSSPNVPCGPLDTTATVVRFSPNGSRLGEAGFNLTAPGWVPLGFSLDPSADSLWISGLPGVHSVTPRLYALNLSLSGAPETIPLPIAARGLTSTTLDAPDGLMLVAIVADGLTNPTNLSTFVHGTYLLGFNASTYAPVYETLTASNASTGVLWGGLAFDPMTDTAFVASETKAVLRFVGATGAYLGDWNLTGGVALLADDPGRGILYALGDSLLAVSTSGGNSTSTELANFSTLTPDPVAANLVDLPEPGGVVVAEHFSGTLTFAYPPSGAPTPVTFDESGLPPGVNWSVRVGGSAWSGSGSVTFLLTNGSYSYSVQGPAGYAQTALPPSGNLTVAGSPVTEPEANFGIVAYPTTFQLAGPPGAPEFHVFLRPLSTPGGPGYCPSCSRFVSNQSFALPNGTYAYFVELYGAGYRFVGGSQEGTVVVHGAASYVNLTIAAAPTYTLTVRAGGLAPGTLWCATVATVLTDCSTVRAIAFTGLTPGTYDYAVATPSGFTGRHLSGSVVLSSSGRGVSATFAPTRYLLTLFVQGLHPGEAWKFTLAGRSVVEYGRYAALKVPNGTYAFEFHAINGFTLANGSGTVVVNGSGAGLLAVYTPARFNVTFVESGLPFGQVWWVHIGGSTYYSNTSSLVVPERGGLYGVSVGSLTPYVGAARPDPVRVAGGPATVTVTFHS